MPKRVDHRARRTQIADALMRLAAAEGLEAVSLRHVAAEARVSTGMVQHYFRTKDEMMAFALDVVMDNIQGRLTADAGARRGTPSPRDDVRALLVQLLPLDEQRSREGHVALAFLAYAATKPALAEGLSASAARMRAHLADLIRASPGDTDTAPAADPELAAATLLALVDGLGVHALSGQLSADDALAALDAHLGVLFGAGDGGG
ncbi:TetR/AcrR family transcriptional regulator [Nocardiopsis sediminis]|uniref:TetR/AcrR family transcriptional regulator n=1 Tax=Nocardiopsis sediminis TaxID=1778267 RepID=A0ABV8FKV8_9ACTN